MDKLNESQALELYISVSVLVHYHPGSSFLIGISEVLSCTVLALQQLGPGRLGPDPAQHPIPRASGSVIPAPTYYYQVRIETGRRRQLFGAVAPQGASWRSSSRDP